MTDGNQGSTLKSRLLAVWRRKQRRHLFAGLLAMCRWGIPLFLLGMAIDRVAYLPTAGRAVILLLLLGVSLYKAWRHGWRHLRRFDAARTALAIEDQHGGLESLLVTAVQFGNSESPSGTSAALWKVTRQNAEGAAGDLQPGKIVDFKKLRIPASVALALAGVMLVFGVVNGPL
ncbi:MAG: hypothetical protein VCA38_21615, partial [Roseibacillus sp.]